MWPYCVPRHAGGESLPRFVAFGNGLYGENFSIFFFSFGVNVMVHRECILCEHVEQVIFLFYSTSCNECVTTS